MPVNTDSDVQLSGQQKVVFLKPSCFSYDIINYQYICVLTVLYDIKSNIWLTDVWRVLSWNCVWEQKLLSELAQTELHFTVPRDWRQAFLKMAIYHISMWI